VGDDIVLADAGVFAQIFEVRVVRHGFPGHNLRVRRSQG
jgi:hypothetical protein